MLHAMVQDLEKSPDQAVTNKSSDNREIVPHICERAWLELEWTWDKHYFSDLHSSRGESDGLEEDQCMGKRVDTLHCFWKHIGHLHQISQLINRFLLHGSMHWIYSSLVFNKCLFSCGDSYTPCSKWTNHRRSLLKMTVCVKWDWVQANLKRKDQSFKITLLKCGNSTQFAF